MGSEPKPNERNHDYYLRMIQEARAEHIAKGHLQADNEDMVNSPPHYNKAGIETIDAIQAATDEGFEYYLQGNIIKYLWRYRYKGKPVEDLKKAEWYLNKLIEIKVVDDYTK